jgi:hypothetical protein
LTLPANIRVNVRAPFPSRVQGASFIQVSKSNGVWTITANYELLANFPSLTGTQVIVAFDPASGQFGLLTAPVVSGDGAYRLITASGAINVLGTDVVILTNLATPAAVNIVLPQSSVRNGLPITVKDIAGNANTYNITFVPFSGETIDGFSAAAAAANGVAVIDVNYGKKTLYPLTFGGWYLI